jgi:hypothetical protein
MNKYVAIVAVAMFALGAVAGHSMTAPTSTTVAASAPVSAFELMRNAPAMPDQTTDQAV